MRDFFSSLVFIHGWLATCTFFNFPQWLYSPWRSPIKVERVVSASCRRRINWLDHHKCFPGEEGTHLVQCWNVGGGCGSCPDFKVVIQKEWEKLNQWRGFNFWRAAVVTNCTTLSVGSNSLENVHLNCCLSFHVKFKHLLNCLQKLSFGNVV